MDRVLCSAYVGDMIRIDLTRFSLSLALLGELITLAIHPRTRERLLAIFLIAQGDSAATVCRELQRDHHTVLKWAHDVSSGGPSALVYKHSGGTPSQLCSLAPLLVDVVEESWSLAALSRVKKNANAPVQLGKAEDQEGIKQTDLVTTPQATPEQTPFLPPAVRWTLRTLCALVLSITGRLVSRETLRKLLHQTGYSFKRRSRILLGKADPKLRAEFVLELAHLVKESQQEDGPLLVFSDEAHIHLEANGGSGWSRKGVPLYVNSHSPQRGSKLSCFGFYALGSDRPVLLHTASWATAETTNEALRKLREQHPERRIIVIWDNVRYHHSRLVRAEAAQLGIELRFLPPYSPDLMPVERLWSWLRQELTYLHCHPSEQQLAERIATFVAQLLDEPATVHKRLRPKLSLNPQEEFLRV